MIKQWMDKLGMKDKKNTRLYVILLVVALVLLIGGRMISSLSSTGPPKSDGAPTAQLAGGTAGTDNKQELESILSQMQGVGNVSVMVSYQTGPEKMLANDVSQQSSVVTEKDPDGSGKSTNEQKSDSSVVKMSDQPVVIKEVYAIPKGVVVVAEGAGDPTVKRNIIEAVKSVLDVPEHRISVFVKKTGR